MLINYNDLQYRKLILQFQQMPIFFFKIFWGLVFFTFVLNGCSLHFLRGQELEAQERWEEASTEYQLALASFPDDEEIKDSLNRVNVFVAEDNMLRYKEMLEKKEYYKAYHRLVSAKTQNPNLQSAQDEIKRWTKVLIAGHAEFDFSEINYNLHFVDEINLEVHFQNPSGRTLKAPISYETGVFFVEDLLYNTPIQKALQYTMKSAGVKLVKKLSPTRKSVIYRKFIQFRTTGAQSISGTLSISQGTEERIQLKQRLQLGMLDMPLMTPPKLFRYSLHFNHQQIQINHSRLEPFPNTSYVNGKARRIFVDFGSYQFKRTGAIWQIRKLAHKTIADDYFIILQNNFALFPYFFYREGQYHYVSKQQ